MVRGGVIALVLAVSAFGCGAGGNDPRPPATATPKKTWPIVAPPPAPPIASAPLPAGDVDSLETIPSAAHWALLRARPDSEHLSNTEVVKFVIDRSDGRVYFLRTERWPIHYDFAHKFLSTPERPVEDHAAFNNREYHDPDRRFLLGSVSHYLDAGVWTFEMLPSDDLDIAVVATAFEAIRARSFFGADLRFRPVSAPHERDLDRARSLMPVVTTDEIFGKLRYQPLELGESYGYLRLIRRADAAKIAALTLKDIAVLEALPEEVPVVAGVISAELQAPLGHINVLCHNRKTPNMALRGALADAQITALQGKLVHLVVEGQSFRIEPADEAAAARSWQTATPTGPLSPKRDDTDIGMPFLVDARARDVSYSGAKAAQLARAAKDLPNDAIPKAFVLPFHAYAAFLRANGFDKQIHAMLSSPDFARDPARRRADLSSLRDAMESAPVPPEILKALLARIKQTLPAGPVRFRSSTNAEDLPGFNGAGLYRSIRVNSPTDEAEVASALRKVWASVWLPGAFEERQFYHIDHESVGMAILVQTSIDDNKASGVAITANPFNQGQPGYFINAQIATGSVTGARGDEVPEQILYYTFEGGRGIERLSRSSLSKDREILSAAQIEELAMYLSIIHLALGGSLLGTGERAIDVEFLVSSSGHIVIVQARPYTMRWSGDRRWKLTFD